MGHYWLRHACAQAALVLFGSGLSLCRARGRNLVAPAGGHVIANSPFRRSRHPLYAAVAAVRRPQPLATAYFSSPLLQLPLALLHLLLVSSPKPPQRPPSLYQQPLPRVCWPHPAPR